MDLLRLMRVMNELIFVLIGGLLLWVAWAGRYFFDPRQPSWLILAGVLILWGVYTIYRSLRITAVRTRVGMRIGGGSVLLVGAIMASLTWAPFHWAGLLLAAAGAVFVLRGLVTTAVLAWPS